MFQPIQLITTRSRIQKDTIAVTMRVKGKQRGQNSADFTLTAIIEDNKPIFWVQIGHLNGTLALMITEDEKPNSIRVAAMRGKHNNEKRYSYVVSSQPACIAIFKHFGEEPPLIPDTIKTLILKANKVPNVDGLFTLSLIKKQ